MGFLDDEKDWRYDHRSSNGQEVDAHGRDKQGLQWYGTRSSSSGNSTNSSSSTGSGDTGGIIWLIGLGIGWFIVYKVIQFITENWVTIVVILGTCIVCAIICIIIQKKAENPGGKIFLVILASLGIIFAVLYFGPAKISAVFNNLQSNILQSRTDTQENVTIMYGYVTSDALNIRSEPTTNSKVIGLFSKNDRVQITGKSGAWLVIKFENNEAYIDSSFVQLEEK
jgi:uncharacterized protein YgiM (DUF1202 family)